jgi:Domain of unknown function (DUF4372)
VTRVRSIFSQILQLIPRLESESAVRQHHAERHARGFSSWGQFIAMLFCQLGHAKSLREICGGLAASEGKLRHLGLPTAPSRSTQATISRTGVSTLGREVRESPGRGVSVPSEQDSAQYVVELSPMPDETAAYGCADKRL